VATPAEATAYRNAQRDVVALARADLASWWRGLDVSDARAAVAALEAVVPTLVAVYGDAAASVAADWYDLLRESAGAPGAYRAVLAEPAPATQVRASARWAAGPLFAADPDPDHALGLLSGSVQRLVQQAGRRTMFRNGASDPASPRWARVPHGISPCAFCRMLASRGAVYLSARTAGRFDQWHDDCNCQPEPVWSGQEPSYDADALYEQYLVARAQAGGNTRAILAQMREDLGVN